MSAKNFEFDQNRVSELVKNKLDSNELSIYGSSRSPEFYTQVKDGKFLTIVQNKSGRIEAHDSLVYLGNMKIGSRENYENAFRALFPLVFDEIVSISLAQIQSQNDAILSTLKQIEVKLQKDEFDKIQAKIDEFMYFCNEYLSSYKVYFEAEKSKQIAYEQTHELRRNTLAFCTEIRKKLDPEIDLFVNTDGKITGVDRGVYSRLPYRIEDGYREQLRFYLQTYHQCVCVAVIAAILEWYFFDHEDRPDYYDMLKKTVSSELSEFKKRIEGIKQKVSEEQQTLRNTENCIKWCRYIDSDPCWGYLNRDYHYCLREIDSDLQDKLQEQEEHFKNMCKKINGLTELSINKLPFISLAPDAYPDLVCHFAEELISQESKQESKVLVKNPADGVKDC